MSRSDFPNPYAISAMGPPEEQTGPLNITGPDMSKIEAVIKDAGQFWLAIILCLVCNGIGSLLIGPWYIARLTQWNNLKKKYPALMNPAPPKTLQSKFQSAQWKLIVGISFGGVMLLFVILYLILIIVFANIR